MFLLWNQSDFFVSLLLFNYNLWLHPHPLSPVGCRRRSRQHQAVRPGSVQLRQLAPLQLVAKMANVVLEFKASAGDSEPQSRPVLIIGQQTNLQQVGWNQIKGKLQPVVSKEVM